MNRKSFAGLRNSQGVASFIPSKFDNKKIREYGGLVIKDTKKDTTDKDLDEGDNYYVSFKRQKSRVFAETLLFKSDNEEKSFIDQTFFDFGVDKKQKGVSFNLTLKY